MGLYSKFSVELDCSPKDRFDIVRFIRGLNWEAEIALLPSGESSGESVKWYSNESDFKKVSLNFFRKQIKVVQESWEGEHLKIIQIFQDGKIVFEQFETDGVIKDIEFDDPANNQCQM